MLATHSSPMDRPVTRSLLGLSFGLFGALFAAPLVSANDTAASADTETAGAGNLIEIVVTATRREENISKVPLSITALNQDCRLDWKMTALPLRTLNTAAAQTWAKRSPPRQLLLYTPSQGMMCMLQPHDQKRRQRQSRSS